MSVSSSRSAIRKGLHHVMMFVRTTEPHFAAGSLEVRACRKMNGEHNAIVEFDYDGVIPSDSGTNLSNPTRHEIFVRAVDTEGNIRGAFFTLIEVSQELIATLQGSNRGVTSIAFSPDGATIASGSNGGALQPLERGSQRPYSHIGCW